MKYIGAFVLYSDQLLKSSGVMKTIRCCSLFKKHSSPAELRSGPVERGGDTQWRAWREARPFSWRMTRSARIPPAPRGEGRGDPVEGLQPRPSQMKRKQLQFRFHMSRRRLKMCFRFPPLLPSPLRLCLIVSWKGIRVLITPLAVLAYSRGFCSSSVRGESGLGWCSPAYFGFFRPSG